MAKRGSRPDLLQVQIALKLRAPKNARISPRVLQQILDRAADGKELPPGVEFRGVVWRNPNRKGSLSHWRYHTGADLDKIAPKDVFGRRYIDGVLVEDTPRGSLREAIDTLAGAIYSGTITF
jgi:hypothetical protein